MWRLWSFLGFALAGTLWAGCRHALPAAPVGESSIQFVRPPPSRPSANGNGVSLMEEPRDLFVDATPIGDLALPVYPAAALAARAGLVKVGARITVGTDGRISNVAPSLVAVSVPNRFSNEFQAAVEAAVAQWRFQPAKIRHLEQAPDGEGKTYLRLAREETVARDFEVVFTFSASGDVLTGMGTPR